MALLQRWERASPPSLCPQDGSATSHRTSSHRLIVSASACIVRVLRHPLPPSCRSCRKLSKNNNAVVDSEFSVVATRRYFVYPPASVAGSQLDFRPYYFPCGTFPCFFPSFLPSFLPSPPARAIRTDRRKRNPGVTATPPLRPRLFHLFARPDPNEKNRVARNPTPPRRGGGTFSGRRKTRKQTEPTESVEPR